MIRKAMANGAMLTSRNLAKNLGESPGLATASCLVQRCARKRIIDTTPAAAAKATMVVIVVTVVVVTVVITTFLLYVNRIAQVKDFVNKGVHIRECTNAMEIEETRFDMRTWIDRAIILLFPFVRRGQP